MNSIARYLRWLVAAGAAALLVLTVANAHTRKNFISGPNLTTGALIAAIALGVVLTFRGSGVVNFANSAIAMYVAYVYAILRKDGDLFLPPLPNPFAPIEGIVHKLDKKSTFKLPHWPTRISFGPNMQFWPALIIALLFAVLFGLILHFLIFRPLRNAPPLAKVVASVGLFVFLQAVALRRFGIQPVIVKPVPFLASNHLIKLPLGISMNPDQFWITLLVIAFALALWLVYSKTRFGLATRASSENEKGAVLLGFSPELLAGANWVISTLITGLLGVFASTVTKNVDPGTLPSLIVPALAAALVGSFTSFGWTTFAAFLLGMQTGVISYVQANFHWYPKSGTNAFPGGDKIVPLLVIVLVLFLLGKSLPTRGAISSGRLPFSPTPPKWAMRYGGPALAIGAAVCALFLFTPPFRFALSSTLVGIIICLSIVVLTGFVGQISLAQMAFAGISAFFVSHMTSEHNVPFPIPILLGALVATVVGVAVALPALRVRGVNLAIVTLGFAVAVDAAIFGNDSVTGGFRGAKVTTPKTIDESRSVKLHVLGFNAGDGKIPNPKTAIFLLIVVVILAYLVSNMRRSGTGRRMLALRSNERAAAAAGVNVQGTKILAFAVSAFIAGVGGAVIAYRGGSVTSDKFTYITSLTFLAFAYLGGISSVSGAVAGGFLVANGLVFTFLQDIVGISSDFTLIIGGLGLIITAVRNPEGISGAFRDAGQLLRRRRGGGDRPALVPAKAGH
jgi:branched-chain amino acid transport system permease protein